MTRSTILALAFAALGSTAFAADAITDSVVSQLQARGYDRIEVERSGAQIRVEAVGGTQKYEAVIDRETGQVLRQEASRATLAERNRESGVHLSDAGTVSTSGDDDHEDDHGTGHDRSDDDHSGRGDHDGSDDDHDEDHDDSDHGGRGDSDHGGRGDSDHGDDHDDGDDHGDDD
ncbi:PepSY domain-containing protein [Mesobacterium pallidum]|uniref:PepSY domain-containing protein n=1 Tax=Mesobacterium pallidum TaxID=2872037 RepID=UPI001EE1F615|nr:PepSY domain-containing protein [Mesobacterium pallidum]